MSDLVQRAKELAHRAHAGQVDKAGRPYIEHVARVAAAVSDDLEAEAVGWLHDVLEDVPELHPEIEKFPAHIVRACYHLDHGWSESDHEYYACMKRCGLALRVKLADIADNSDEARLALLDPKTADRLRRKYKRALEMLGQPPTN
jgi:(p)ppGpp synthase/HD superfamily hydrolase